MKTTYPKKLKIGDSVKIIAPSSSAKTFTKKRLNNAIKNFKKIGFNIQWSKNAFEINKLTQSSSVKSRILDLHASFEDKNISMVSCVRGGFNSNELLPHINWELIKQNPKIICGFSDITALANAIYTKTGIITYIGPNFSTFGVEKQSDYTFNYFKKCLTSSESFEIVQSTKWGQKKGEILINKHGIQVIQKGYGKNIVIGGNLCTLNLLQGTPYMPSINNKILFIEEDDFGGKLTPLEFERNLESLLQTGNRKNIRGLVIGRFQKDANMTFQKLKEIISRRNLPKGIPIICNVDFGHTMPMITFPIGGEIEINAGSKVKILVTKH